VILVAVALLDVNVLLALAWPNDHYHRAARQWFVAQRSQRWATCPLTQLAFVRLSAQPVVVKATITIPEALRFLETAISAPEPEFWPLEDGLNLLLPEICERLIGHRRLTDAVLLDLAIRKAGKLATFDRGIANLLSSGSSHRGALEIIPLA
jgi:uncharacterized protein